MTLSVTRDWIIQLIREHNWGPGECLVVVTAGPEQEWSGFDLWELAESYQREMLTDVLPDEMRMPTVVETLDDAPVFPAAVSVIVHGVEVSFPLLPLSSLEDDLTEVFSTIVDLPTDVNDGHLIDKVRELLRPHMQRGTMWVSGALSRSPGNEEFSTFWLFADELVDGEWKSRYVVLSGENEDGLHTTVAWDRWWSVFEAWENSFTLFTWEEPTLREMGREDGKVVFELADSGGAITLRIPANTYEMMIEEFASVHGFTLLDEEDSEEQDQDTGPTAQPAGAVVHNDMIVGNVNVSGSVVLNGMVTGDVLVPGGADVDIRGMVTGTVRVSGGTARLYGMIAAAEITAGRIEVYGRLQSRLRHNGGEVFFHPDSIMDG